MAGLSKFNTKDKEIIFLDYEGLSPEEIIQTMKDAEALIVKEGKMVLTLTNFTDAFATKAVMNQAKELKKGIMTLSERSAIYGLSAAKTVLLKGFNKVTKAKGIVPFKTKEAAIEYLVK